VFQTVGPETAKLCGPYVTVLVLGTSRSPCVGTVLEPVSSLAVRACVFTFGAPFFHLHIS